MPAPSSVASDARAHRLRSSGRPYISAGVRVFTQSLRAGAASQRGLDTRARTMRAWPVCRSQPCAARPHALTRRGIGRSAELSLVMAVMDLGTQSLPVSLGLVLDFDPPLPISQFHVATAPSCGQTIFALSVSTVAYTGIETVSNMA